MGSGGGGGGGEQGILIRARGSDFFSKKLSVGGLLFGT